MTSPLDSRAHERPARRHIGARLTRAHARRLVSGRGRFVDDNILPNTAHAAFLRSPHAHAEIVRLDTSEAQRRPGVVAVLTGRELAAHISPWRGVLTHIPGLRSAQQHALAIERARWQGEPLAVVVAESRAEAEDALDGIEIEWRPLPIIADPRDALEPAAPVIHPELGSNLAFQRSFSCGAVEEGFAAAHSVVEQEFRFCRQTGVTPEPRTILAEFVPPDGPLTIHHSGQTPHVVQALFARHLGLAEQQVHVISPDVGGAYGIKIHMYGDEIAVAALARLLRRPVKFVADRLESFTTDIHARGHRVRARLALDADGKIAAFAVDDLMEIGPFSAYPRASVHEVNQLINMCGAPYAIANYCATGRVVLQNKNLTSQFRGVGHPMLTTVCEGMIDLAAAKAGLDPVEVRRRNLIADDAYPRTSPTGRRFDGNSHHACLERLLALMDYDALRAEQAMLRRQGVLRGIGIASFVESTGPGPTIYGSGGAPISAQDTTLVRLEPSGGVTCCSGVTDQGQGTATALAQIVADAVGIAPESVRVLTGDTDTTPYGGGTWGSRGIPIGGEATWQAGRALRRNILTLAANLLQVTADDLDIAAAVIVDREGRARMTLADLARIAFYNSAELPEGVQPELTVARSFRPAGDAHAYTNGVHGSHLELDVETGFIRLVGHWVVEDCGVMVNPLLVEEQIRGGVALGLGWALLEECAYSTDGQLRNASMADYLVPMAADLPDIIIAHIETPTHASELGAKGAGESGVVAAPAAVFNAVNDALAPLGACVTQIPVTPRHVLTRLAGTGGRGGRP